jgi:hypothetical protein
VLEGDGGRQLQFIARHNLERLELDALTERRAQYAMTGQKDVLG